MSKRYGFLVDLRRCVGCTSCQVSCKMENGVPIGSFRARVEFANVGDFPQAKRYFLPLFCNHCDNPPCVLPCPVPGATYKREDGMVAVNRDLCIGCGLCVSGCPYGARFLHADLPVKNDPAPYHSKVPGLKDKAVSALRVVDKCNWCSHRLEAGEEETACMRNCFGKAIVFGDMNDPNSRISKLLATEKTFVLHPEYNTKPRVHYIAPDPAALKEAGARVDGLG